MVGGSEKLYNHDRNQSDGSSEKLEIDLPQDSAVSILGIYLQMLQRHCSKMFLLLYS